MKSFLILVAFAMVLTALGFLALGIRIFLQKNGKFPNTSVGGNKFLAQQGIKCARCEEMAKYRKWQKKQAANINPEKLKVAF
ncbi:MAG: hypothetical protein ACOC31_04770 [Bacteroidota bacterium]